MTSRHERHHRAVCREGDYDEYIDKDEPSHDNQHRNGKNHPSTIVTFLKFCVAFCSILGLYQSFTLGLSTLISSQRERIRQREQHQQQDSLLWVNDQSLLPREEEDTEIDDADVTVVDYTHLQCYNESFGFFTDVLNKTWMRMKRSAQQSILPIHQYKFPGFPERAHGVPTRWYARNLLPVFSCPHVIRVGGHGEGPKWTCDPHLLQKEYQDVQKEQGYRNGDCLIYSVGCHGQYHWEIGLVELLREYRGEEQQQHQDHCEIHVFDPGPYERRGWEKQYNIHYHQWGLTSSYDADYHGQKDAVMLTFQETVNRLRHVNRTLDVFKIDCEGCEWASFEDWLFGGKRDAHPKEVEKTIKINGTTIRTRTAVAVNSSKTEQPLPRLMDIRQILVETHGVPLHASRFFQAMVDEGFAMFSKEANVYANGQCVEFGFVKLSQDFWKT